MSPSTNGTEKLEDFTSHLPAEINSRIFCYCDHEGFHRKPGPLVLAAVSRAWRQIAFTTPQLWASLEVTIQTFCPHDLYFKEKTKKSPRRAVLIEQWLSRSGQLPLDIKIFHTPRRDSSIRPQCEHSIIQAIGKYAHRWRRLVLVGFPTDTPLLSLFQGQGSPHKVELRDLTIGALHNGYPRPKIDSGFRFDMGTELALQPERVSLFYVPVQRVNINWSNLVHLQLSALPMSDVCFVLSQSTKLETCLLSKIQISRTLMEVLEDSEEYLLPEKPILLTRLLKLEINMNDWEEGGSRFHTMENGVRSLSFLAQLTLPHLQELAIDMGYSSDYSIDSVTEHMLSFLSRSSCSLLKLSLHYPVYTRLDLIRLMYKVPSLKELKLEICPRYILDENPHLQKWAITDDFFSHYMNEIGDRSMKLGSRRPFIPALDVFCYKGAKFFTYENFYKFASAFHSHAPPAPVEKPDRKRYINVELLQERGPDDLEKLIRLCDEGLDISLLAEYLEPGRRSYHSVVFDVTAEARSVLSHRRRGGESNEDDRYSK